VDAYACWYLLEQVCSQYDDFPNEARVTLALKLPMQMRSALALTPDVMKARLVAILALYGSQLQMHRAVLKASHYFLARQHFKQSTFPRPQLLLFILPAAGAHTPREQFLNVRAQVA